MVPCARAQTNLFIGTTAVATSVNGYVRNGEETRRRGPGARAAAVVATATSVDDHAGRRVSQL